VSSIDSSVCVAKGDSYSFGLKLDVADLTGYLCTVSLRNREDIDVIIDTKTAPLVDGVFIVSLWPSVSDTLLVSNKYVLSGTIENDTEKFSKTSAVQIIITQDLA
jgi:hypothetical protein